VASADDGLGVTGSDVPVGRDDADVIREAAHMEVLGGLLLIEEAVVATAHRLFGAENREGTSFAVARHLTHHCSPVAVERAHDKALPRGATMNGTILVYGNDPMLVTTCGLILEKAGYKLFSAETLGNAMLVLMNHQIDVCVLCQSLRDEERRGIVEAAHALQAEIKCAVLDFEERENTIGGVDLV
jgi:hypothetical protein